MGRDVKVAPAVRRSPKRIGLHVHGVRVLRVGNHVHVGRGVAPEISPIGDELPRRAAVVGAEQGALVCLDNRPDTARTRRRDRDTNLPDHPLRQTRVASNVRPGVTAIGRLVQAAVGSPADIVPRKTLQLIERRVEHIGVGRVHREVERAGPIALVQDLLPGLATVLRAIDAPLGIGPEDVAHGCHEHDVGILGVDADLRDVAGFLEPHVGPCLSAIGRLVDPVSRCQVLSRQRFARADVHHGGVRQGHVDRPYRRPS